MVNFILNPPHRAKRPKKSYRSSKIWLCLFIFFHVAENEPKEDAHVPRTRGLPCASPNRSMKQRLVPPYGVVKLARVLTIWRLLRASLHMTPCLTARCLRHRPVATVGARGNSPA